MNDIGCAVGGSGAAQRLFGLSRMALLHQGCGAVQRTARGIGLRPDRALIARRRLFKPPMREKELAEMRQRVGVHGVQLNGAAEGGHRLDIARLLMQGQSEIVMEDEAFRTEADGALEMRDRSGRLPCGKQAESQIVMAAGVVRLEANRMASLHNGRLSSARRAQRASQFIADLGVSTVERGGSAQELDGLGGASSPAGNHAVKQQRGGEIGRDREQLARFGFCLGIPGRLKIQDRVIQELIARLRRLCGPRVYGRCCGPPRLCASPALF